MDLSMTKVSDRVEVLVSGLSTAHGMSRVGYELKDWCLWDF
jgi:hypothetical protein